MTIFGNSMLFCALFTSIVAIFLYILAYSKDWQYMRYANIMTAVVVAFLVITILCVLYLFMFDEFKYVIVSAFSDKQLPILYKIVAIIVAKDTSFIVIAVMVLVGGYVASRRIYGVSCSYYSAYWISIVFIAFLLILVTVTTNSVFMLNTIQFYDGTGLPVYIQNFKAFIYSLSWYILFVSAAIMISHAFAAMVVKDFTSYWVRSVRSWIYVALPTSVIYLLLGHHWLESTFLNVVFLDRGLLNIASLLPLLVMIVFFHTASIYIARDKCKRYAFIYPLLLITVVLISGYVMKVNLSEVGYYGERLISNSVILWVTAIIAVAYVMTYVKSWKIIPPSYKSYSSTSRWLLIYIMNIAFLILISSGLILLIVNIYSLFYYNTLSVFKSSYYYTVLMLVSSIGLLLMGSYVGYRYIKRGGITRIKQRYFFAHSGIIMISLGLILSQSLSSSTIYNLTLDNKIYTNGYNILVKEINSVYKDNYVSIIADIELEGGRFFSCGVYPELRGYSTMVGYVSVQDSATIFTNSYYVGLVSYDLLSGRVMVAVTIRPFLFLVPLGMIFMLIGIFQIWRFKRYY